ncbi:MAG: CcmD family protein [Calditrichaeota bacterium]|nr:MAG: CcmD family protein [Calditrichota bacterium]MBL1206917.1 CcmD family protein [Calditrichota bacterium]NOG46744.1 CcmD family protein [Calditrichota bacterium]
MSDIYVVLGIILIVWVGIFGYLLSLQSKISQLKKRLDEKLSE